MQAILILLIVLIFLSFLFGMVHDRRNTENRNAYEKKLDEFPHDFALPSLNFSQALLIDEARESLIILQDLDQDEVECEIIPFSRILEVALIQNGEAVLSFPKNNVLESGGDIAGDVEDVEEEEEEELIDQLSLKVLVDDLTNPLKEFYCIDEDDYIQFDSDEFWDAYDECFDWYHKLVVLIKRSERNRVR